MSPDLQDELYKGLGFVIKPLAMNYKYRPNDEAILSKHPHLRYLPSKEEALYGKATTA